MYLMVCAMPDLAHYLSAVSTFVVNPRTNQWNAVKWILSYVKATVYVVLMYTQDNVNS